jgi:hypothetical protein
MPEAAGKRGRARAQLVEVLIGAVCAGGARLSRVRSEFERMDAVDGLKRLVLQAVDPDLLAAVVGPRLAPAWVVPLRAQYARFQQAYPADWVDVEKVWRQQRTRWRFQEAAGAASDGSQAAARGYPVRGVRGEGRAAPPRTVRPSAAAASAPRPVARAAPAHRPVPPAGPAVHDPDVEAVAAPPDDVVSGAVSAEVAEAAEAADAAERGSRQREATRRSPAVPAAAGAFALPAGCNGAPADPLAPPRPAVPARAPVAPAASSGDGRIELSGRAGELVERLLQAMTESRARVESVRRVWIDADEAPGGWDLWALDPAVIDGVRALQRGVER